jgi:hypothetical protein
MEKEFKRKEKKRIKVLNKIKEIVDQYLGVE